MDTSENCTSKNLRTLARIYSKEIPSKLKILHSYDLIKYSVLHVIAKQFEEFSKKNIFLKIKFKIWMIFLKKFVLFQKKMFSFKRNFFKINVFLKLYVEFVKFPVKY